MIRVGYILNAIEFGGAEKVSLNFLTNVNRDRFQICPLLFIRPWEKKNFLLQEINKEKYCVHQIPVAFRSRDEGREYFRLIRCFKIIFTILVKGEFDLIHTHGYFADIIAIPAAKLLGIPVISTCHGFIENDKNLKRYNKIDRISLKFSNKIIAVSQEIKNGLVECGIKESRIKVVLNAVQTDTDQEIIMQDRYTKRCALDFGELDFVLGYIGRVSREKGIHYLLDAAEILSRRDIPIKVLVIGDGPAKKESELLVRQKGLEDKVFFVGFQTDVRSWIPAMDVFVLPSLTEGTPMALLEAMACRVPVVASAVGGVPQIIDSGKDGILIAPGKPEDLAAGVMELYSNNFLRESFVEAAYQKTRSTFDIKEWTETIESQYTEIAR